MMALILLIIGIAIAALGWRWSNKVDWSELLLPLALIVLGGIIAVVGIVWAFLT